MPLIVAARNDERPGAINGDSNQLGYALQLCAFRYPGRLLRPADAIPEPALRFYGILSAGTYVGLKIPEATK